MNKQTKGGVKGGREKGSEGEGRKKERRERVRTDEHAVIVGGVETGLQNEEMSESISHHPAPLTVLACTYVCTHIERREREK
jgi:hypothetical protein